MGLLLKGLREGLGHTIALGSYLIPPKTFKRSNEKQQKVDNETNNLFLYQFYACPFCTKARRAIRRLGLKIPTRDAQRGQYREELLAEGGQIKVPCLKIIDDEKITWLYESKDIIAYLDQRFG